MKVSIKRTLTLFLSGSISQLWILPGAVNSEEVVNYEFTLKSVLGNAYSPDCQNLQQQRRWLFLASEGNHMESGEARSTGPTSPGPTIEANEGDTIVVRVINDHPTLGASIHFHGIHQKGTPWSDGTAQITQCPLGPHQTQEYEFKAYPPGTHFWHAHASLDVADGLSGLLIVHPKEPPTTEGGQPLEYDEERVLFLQDFYSETGEQQRAGLDNWPFTWIGNPDSLLINGRGIARACLLDGANFGNTNVCLETCEDTAGAWLPTIVDVEENKTYRLRIVNGGQLVMQNVAIVDHTMTIVEVEGTIVDPPITVSNYDLSPGQRVSVLITTDKEPGNYLIETTVRERDMPGLTGRAILRYNNATIDSTNIGDVLAQTPFHPVWNDSEEAKDVDDLLRTGDVSKYEEASALQIPEAEIKRWVLVGTQNQIINEFDEIVQLRWAVNNVSNIPSAEPLIGMAVRAAKLNGWPTELGEDVIDIPQLPPFAWNYTMPVVDPGGPGPKLGQHGVAVIQVSEGDVFELVLQNARALNGVAEFHPWHSHGHSFWVVGRGEGIFDPEVDPANYNLEDPLLRDTATLWPLGWTALRFLANNPGVWFFHCHITSHLTMGMSFAIIVEPDMIGDPSESVAFCGQTSLDPNSGGGEGSLNKQPSKKGAKSKGKNDVDDY